MEEKLLSISKKDAEELLVRVKRNLQGHEYIETNDFQKLGYDSVLIRFLSFHWIKFLKQFPKQLENYNSEILYNPVSPSEKVALILLKLQDATIQVSTKEFISFIQNLLQFHNFKSELLNLDDIPKALSSEFKQGAEIGRGGFGVVYRGIWEGMDVAIKQLHLGNLENDLLQEFIKEAKIMHKCRHPNIVLFFAICIESGKNSLIMEYLPNGSLFQNLSNSSVNMPWFPLRWNIALDIAKGLNYLHSRNILHQDMKSMNILLDKDRKAKISDFGLAIIKSTIAASTTSSNNKTKTGSIRWNAPELFKRGTKRSKETDVYSFGMTLWEISSRKIPFSEEPDDMMIATFIKDGEKENIPKDCPLPFSQIITKCWNSNPKERPSMSDVIVNLEKNIGVLSQNESPGKKNREKEEEERKRRQKEAAELARKKGEEERIRMEKQRREKEEEDRRRRQKEAAELARKKEEEEERIRMEKQQKEDEEIRRRLMNFSSEDQNLSWQVPSYARALGIRPRIEKQPVSNQGDVELEDMIKSSERRQAFFRFYSPNIQQKIKATFREIKARWAAHEPEFIPENHGGGTFRLKESANGWIKAEYRNGHYLEDEDIVEINGIRFRVSSNGSWITLFTYFS